MLFRSLYSLVSDLEELRLQPPQVNSMYPYLSPAVRAQLQAWSFFWDWDLPSGQVRWMTSWDTTESDVRSFANGVREALRGTK